MSPQFPHANADASSTLQSDVLTQRILASLHHVETPAGLSDRVSQRVREAPSPARVGLAGRVRSLAWPVRWVGGAALAAVLVWAVLLLLPVHRPGTNEVARMAPAASAFPSSAPKPIAPVTTIAEATRSDMNDRVAPAEPRQPAPAAPESTARSAAEALATEETAAPSHPAPPLAMTADERAMQRFAERHNAVEVAVLDPQTEQRHVAAERHDLERFFAPPPEPPGNPPADLRSVSSPRAPAELAELAIESPAPQPLSLSPPKPTPGELLCCIAFTSAASPQ